MAKAFPSLLAAIHRTESDSADQSFAPLMSAPRSGISSGLATAEAPAGAVVVLEARPVYAYVARVTYRGDADPTAMIVGFALVAVLCVAATLIPLRVAVRKLELGEA